MTRIKYLAYLWAFVITQTGFVCSEFDFLKRHEGESVVFPCETKQRNPAPYSVYLKRSWLNHVNVLYMNTKQEFSVDNVADKNRINVSGDPSLHLLNVSISQLKANDTDRYYCEFVAENLTSEDDRIRGKTEFFLLVAGSSGVMCTNDQYCGSCYSSLLHTLPLVVVILILLLTGFVVILKCKAHRSMMTHLEAPVYEEMVGLKPPDQTQAPVHLEEQYTSFPVKRGASENPYDIQEKISPTS